MIGWEQRISNILGILVEKKAKKKKEKNTKKSDTWLRSIDVILQLSL